MKRLKTSGKYCFWMVFLLFSFVACSNGEEAMPTSDSSIRIITATPRNTAIPTVTPTPLVPELDHDEFEAAQIDFWYVWAAAGNDPLGEFVEQFNRDNEFGIQVIPRQFLHPADFEEAMTGAILSRETPDIVLARAYEYNTWQLEGILVDMSPYLDSPSYGLPAEEIEQFYPVFLERDLYGAKRYGFPGLFSASVMLYNQTWAQELGFDAPPASAEGFSRQACAAHLANGDRTGGWMIDTSPPIASAWLLAFAENLAVGNRYTFDSDSVAAAFAFLSDLHVQGCAWLPTESYPDQAFVDRLGLFYPVTTREISFVEGTFAQSGSSDQWTTISYPNDFDEGHISTYGHSYVMIQSSLEEQIASWIFIKSMVSEQNQVDLAEETLYLPVRRDAARQLQRLGRLPRAWLDALNFLDDAVFEPRLASWWVVRGVVQDAVAEVMDERFVPGTMDLFLKNFNQMAAELNQ